MHWELLSRIRWQIISLWGCTDGGAFTKFCRARIFFYWFSKIIFIWTYRWSLIYYLTLHGLRISLTSVHHVIMELVDLWFFWVLSLIFYIISRFLCKRWLAAILRSWKCFLHYITIFFSWVGTLDKQIFYLMVILLIAKDFPHDLFLISVWYYIWSMRCCLTCKTDSTFSWFACFWSIY